MIRPKGLGRGLDALLSSGNEAATSEQSALKSIALDRIRPGKFQPRTQMDEVALAELADSIKEQGVMQPILVRAIDGGRYEIIAGERRWRAAQRAGLSEVPALVKDVDDHNALALALIENLQREDLNPLEEAMGLARLIEEFGLTHDAAAKAVGRSRSAVTNLLRLTQLSKPVQDHLMSGALEMGHARALLALSAPHQSIAATRIVANAMSVRDTERLVATMLHPAKRTTRRANARDTDTLRLENDLAEKLGAKVRIEAGRKGAGRVVINYASLDELEGILARIQ